MDCERCPVTSFGHTVIASAQGLGFIVCFNALPQREEEQNDRVAKMNADVAMLERATNNSFENVQT